MTKVVYWNNIPSPYMVERFNAVADLNCFDFEAWFNERTFRDRSWKVDEASWRFRYRYLPTLSVGNHRFHFPAPLYTQRPDFLVSLYAEPSFITGWALAKALNIKTGFWVEVTPDRWIRRSKPKEFLKKWLFPRTDAIITVGADGKAFAKKYGAKSENIFYAPHTIDSEHFRRGSEEKGSTRSSIREDLGLTGTTFVYVGRLWWVKGILYLLTAFEAAQNKSQNEISLLIIGDGEEEDKLRGICADRSLKNVVFTGFVEKVDLPKYYAASDVFVFPTLGDTYGLVIDEAMACGLPVISTSAVGEISGRVEDGVNGFIVPPENSEALAERILSFANSEERCKTMGLNASEKVVGNTPERWAGDFKDIVEKMLPGSS